MKDIKFLILIVILLSLLILIKKDKISLNTGDIVFTSLNSKGKDSFSIVILKDIPPNTNIFFTDDEWNGNRFGIKESNLVWNSGAQNISAFTEIKFTSIKRKPKSNLGLILGNLNLSQKGDAIFAYTGINIKQPDEFLAVISYGNKNYGTLLNTNLEEGKTAIILPKNIYSASLKEKIKLTKRDIIEQVNDSNNYYYQYSAIYLSNKANQ